jgi:hypothetical protein
MSDDSNFDLDSAVEEGEGVEEWGGAVDPDIEGTEGEFSVEDVETTSTESEGEDGSSEAPKQESKKRGPGYGDIPAEEFAFDATPRPRVAGAKKDSDGKPKVSKDALPEGWTTPTGLVNLLRERRIVDLRPQAMYGWVKNGKAFPWVQHTDGRYIVPIEDDAAAGIQFGPEDKRFTSEIGGVTWVRNQLEKRVQRDQAREAEAAKAAEAEPETTDSQPVVGGVEEVASFES